MSGPTPFALITGGSSGIGLAAAELLLGQGWSAAVTGRSRERLDDAAGQLRPAPGARVTTIVADQSDPSSLRDMITQAQRAHPRLDALILNAGTAEVLPVERHDWSVISRTYAANTLGPLYAVHLAWPIFQRQNAGRIIFVSSYASLDPFPGFFAYCGSKAALNITAASCAAEGAAYNIRAFSVAPGAVETPLLRSAFDRQTVPPSECMTPHQCAHVIAQCATGQRDHHNGRTIFLRRAAGSIEEIVR